MTKYVLLWESANVSPSHGPHIVGYVDDAEAALEWTKQSPSPFIRRYFLTAEKIANERNLDDDNAHPIP